MKALLFVCGEGGHFAQMNRLVEKFDCEFGKETTQYLVSDSSRCTLKNLKPIVLPPLRAKDQQFLLGAVVTLIMSVIQAFSACFRLVFKNNVRAIISTGPGIAVIPAIVVKLSGGVVVHIETWSRFETSSMTGKLMYLLADRFYVQNIEQMRLYRKAKYAGRL